jgi:hypothetical protein
MNIKRILPVLLIFAGIGLASTTVFQAGISGKWVSAAPEKTASGNYGIREFQFSKNNWEVQSTIYRDSLLKQPIFRFRATGRYNITGPSNIPATSEALFHFDKKYLTVLTSDTAIIKISGLGTCVLVPGKESDITETGCSYFASKAACGQEYDLISLKHDSLYLGARPSSGGMCVIEKRPVALGLPLNRK